MLVPNQYQKFKRVRLPRKILFTREDGIVLLPTASSLSDFSDSIQTLFPEKFLNLFFQNLVYPKFVKYRNPIIPSGIDVKRYKRSDIITGIEKALPEWKKPVLNTVTHSGRTILFSLPVFEKFDPKGVISRKRAAFSYFENFYNQAIYWFLHSGKPDQHAFLFSRMEWNLEPLYDVDKKFIIPIPIRSKNQKLAKTIPDIDRDILTANEKRDIDTLLAYSGIDLVRRLYVNMPNENSKNISLQNVRDNLVFFFYNEHLGFFVDFSYLSEKPMKERDFLDKFKLRIREIITINNGEEVEADEDDAEEDDELDEAMDRVEENVEVKQTSNVETRDDLRDSKLKSSIKNNLSSLSKIPMDRISFQDEEELELIRKGVEKELVEKEEEIIEDSEEGETEDVDPDDTNLDDNEIEKRQVQKKAKELRELVNVKKSKKDIARIENLKERYKSIKIDGDKTAEDILKDESFKMIDVEQVPIKVRDNSLETMTVQDFDRTYKEKVFDRDVLEIAKSFSSDKNVNLFLTNFEKLDTSDQFTDKYTYKMQFEDENKKKHTITVDMPKIDENGFLTINGNKKLLKKQLFPIPILKIKPDTVSIASNYNKVIIFRQGTVLNRNVVVAKKVIDFISDAPNFTVQIGKNDNRGYQTIIEYDELASVYHRVKIGSGKSRTTFYFSQREVELILKGMGVEYPKNSLVFGIESSTSKLYTVPLDGSGESVAEVITRVISDHYPPVNDIINAVKVPKRRVYTRMKILSRNKSVALIAFLGSLFGLKKVLETEGVKWEFVEKRIREDRRPNIKFANGYLYYDPYPLGSAMLLNGLVEMDTEDDDFEAFEDPMPYIEYIYKVFKTRNPFKGWAAFKELFLDPITLEVLQDFSLPTDFLEVFLYSNRLLEDNKKEQEKMRVRGYEVMNAILYNSLAKSYQTFKQRSNPKSRNFSVQQNEIFSKLHKAFLLENYDALSPVNEMKMKGVVTFKGPQGINTQEAFTLEKRAYQKEMVGIVSMSSVDSSAVGIVKHLTINPNIKSVRGYFESIEDINQAKDMNASQLASPEELAVPFVNKHDDPKRIGFTSNQTKHVVGVVDSDAPIIGNGFEQSMIYKISDHFAMKAKDDGKCIDVDPIGKIAYIEYRDGTRETVQYGSQIQRNSSFFLTNELELNIRVGQKFKKGHVMSYNKEFFHSVAGNLVMTQGPLCRLALIEDDTTEEDSSSITETLSNKMATNVVNRKQISFGSQSNLIKFMRRGDDVSAGDHLMVFEDFDKEDAEIAAALVNLSSPEEDEALSAITRHTPESKYSGVIHDMRVYWTVPEEELSPSLQKFIKGYKADLMRMIRAEESATGGKSELRKRIEITVPYKDRIQGAIVPDGGGVVVEYYIKQKMGMGVGDKLTFGSSLKSIVATVIPKDFEPYSEFGDTKVDATMGVMSFEARMVTSPYFSGILAKILYERGRDIAKEYLSS